MPRRVKPIIGLTPTPSTRHTTAAPPRAYTRQRAPRRASLRLMRSMDTTAAHSSTALTTKPITITFCSFCTRVRSWLTSGTAV